MRLLLVLALALVAAACDSAAPADLTPYAGVYVGTLTSTERGATSTEGATVTVAVDDAARTISFSIDSGAVLPLSGTYDDGGTITVDYDDESGGTALAIDFVALPDGRISGSYSITYADGLGLPDEDVTGTVSGSLSTSVVRIVFDGSNGVRSDIRATR